MILLGTTRFVSSSFQGKLTARKPLGWRGNLFESCSPSEMLSDVEGRKSERMLWKLAGD